ncbi:MAG: dihydroneopterin triphosphate diphosphatase [Woeseiaceae bacterium]
MPLPGRRPVAELRPEYRRPVSVLVLVYTAGGDILLLHRPRPFDFWQSVTGSLQRDETHTAAASRELAEETGLAGHGELSFSGTSRLFTIDPRWRHRYAPGVTENVEFEWQCRLPERIDIRLNAAEHSEYQWMRLDRAIEAVWSWTNREALVNLRDRL